MLDRLAEFWSECTRMGMPIPSHIPNEADSVRLDSGKARARLGWRPKYGVDQILARNRMAARLHLRRGYARIRA